MFSKKIPPTPKQKPSTGMRPSSPGRPKKVVKKADARKTAVKKAVKKTAKKAATKKVVK
jgi:hypothetical protein